MQERYAEAARVAVEGQLPWGPGWPTVGTASNGPAACSLKAQAGRITLLEDFVAAAAKVAGRKPIETRANKESKARQLHQARKREREETKQSSKESFVKRQTRVSR